MVVNAEHIVSHGPVLQKTAIEDLACLYEGGLIQLVIIHEIESFGPFHRLYLNRRSSPHSSPENHVLVLILLLGNLHS